MTLEDYLAQDAAAYPDKTAVVCGEQSYTYAQLWQEVQQRAADYPGGKVIPFRSSQTVDFIITYLAIHLAGSVAAPLEKDIPDKPFEEIARRLSSNTVPEGTADVLYTTGTTGKSKGVMISHRTIVADAENLIAGQGFSHDLVFVIHGPLNHIGSLSKIYPIILLGGTLRILDGLRDADAFFEAFGNQGNTPPFSYQPIFVSSSRSMHSVSPASPTGWISSKVGEPPCRMPTCCVFARFCPVPAYITPTLLQKQVLSPLITTTTVVVWEAVSGARCPIRASSSPPKG